MGYTHYTIYAKMTEAEFREIVADAYVLCQTALASHGVRTECKADFDALTFELNGMGKDAYEPYTFMGGDMFALRGWRFSPDMFFCKTARKPYDMVVGACMIAMKRHMRERITLSSDGKIEEPDWDKAFRLYHETFPDRPPPPIPFFRTHEGTEARYGNRQTNGEQAEQPAQAHECAPWFSRFGAAAAG